MFRVNLGKESMLGSIRVFTLNLGKEMCLS